MRVIHLMSKRLRLFRGGLPRLPYQHWVMKNPTDAIGANADRRNFLKTSARGALVLGAGAVALNALGGIAQAADDTEVSKPGMAKPVKNEELFRKGVIGPATLSLITSELGVKKATQANAKEFAGFELTEAIAVTTVLKQLGTPVPAPDPMAQEILAKLQAASGSEFDKAYIKAQLANHEFLRDHAEDYLKTSDPKTADPAEQQAQHLATLALATFKEHVAICKRIFGELRA